MRLDIQVNNTTKIPIRKKLLEEAVKKTLKAGGLDFLARKKITLSIAIVSPREIKRLNKIYRKNDMATDVLSFAEYKNAGRLKKEKKDAIFLGELVICPDDIKDYIKREKLDVRKETAKVISHGVLHLLGFKHGKKMLAIQEIISNIFKN